jgi:predicted molibdopterin-dependent oxidoreductase YjgC
MNCDCADKMDELLKNDPETANTKLDIGLAIEFKTGGSKSYFIIATAKRESRSRQKAKTIFATHCPFCGVKCHGQEAA